MRLHIIGIPSAGKTTLGKALGASTRIPVHDLDELAFVDERWTLRPASERDEMVDRILEEPSFVTEGGFLDWTQRLFAAADYIIWLDPPLKVLIWRHIVRHGRNPRRLYSHLRFQVLMYRRPEGSGPAVFEPNQTRSGIERALRPWVSKVLRLRRPVTAQEILDGLKRL